MNDINVQVNRFLADSQWRTAELTIEMDVIKDDGNIGFKYKDNQRLQLSVFMDLLYISDYSFIDGYNFLRGGDDPWSDAEIQAEIDYLRDIGEMSEVPFLTFTDYQQNVVNNIIDDGSTIPGGVSFPYGNKGDFIFYANSGSSPIATPFPINAGFADDTIDAYFLDRT